MLGTASGPLFAQGRELLHTWFAQCEDADIAGADHRLQMLDAPAVATAVAVFLSTPTDRRRSWTVVGASSHRRDDVGTV
jgi:hypothetical protein